MAMRGDFVGEPAKGALHFSRDIALYLSRFMDVYLLGKDDKENKRKFWREKKIEGTTFSFLDPYLNRPFIGRPFDTFVTLRKAWKEIEKTNPDIIYLQEIDFLPLTNLRKPAILHIHGCFKEMLALRYPRLWKLRRYIPNWFANYIQGLLHIFLIKRYSPYLKKILISADKSQLSYLKEKEPLLGEKALFVPLLLDTDTFVPKDRLEARKILNLPDDHFIFLFVGGLDPLKAPNILIHAFKIFKQQNPNSLLLLIGKGTLEKKLRTLVEGLDLEKDVIFLGKIPHSNLPIYYNAADTFVLPSLYEGIPLVSLEALSCGIPIVVSSAIGTSEFIQPGVQGFIVEEGDVESLASALQQAVRLPPETRGLCREIALQFSRERVGKLVKDILFGLLSQ
ncbi:glycosyltransferase family 4 protein [bacterium]|nr:glycosyltransferase family 4 protein [bacterium]